ncbi:MAG TPA: PQQ-binding-like beta-propeller repeat protein [Verrucomicrobiae bacterium]|nr:PQQ-binding-like beta-propeller repeat protein [Verrucomicrobiae bacterium]
MKPLHVLLCAAVSLWFQARAEDWPQFRGPGGLGISQTAKPPIHFDPTTNVLWKVTVPTGNSSPVVTGQKIFLTAVNEGRLETICFDRKNGKVLWSRPAPSHKLEPTHRLGSPATPTPVTDGTNVYSFFGSFGVVAYDLDGKEVWRQPIATPVVEFGTSASPILIDNKLIILCDQDLGSFVEALDKKTGRTIWRTERPEFRRGFATPFHWKNSKDEELIVPGSIWLTSYDPLTGKENWRYSGTSRVATSTPTAGADLLFSASWNVGGDEDSRISMPAFAEYAADHDKNKDGQFTKDELPDGPVKDRFTQMDLEKDGIVTPAEWANMADMFAKAGNAVLAIHPGGDGEISKTHLAWKSTRSLPYVSSPIFYKGRLFTVKNGGLVSAYDVKNGHAIYQDERIDAPGDYYASAVAADDRIYFTSQNGVVTVIAARNGGPTILAQNKLGEQTMATPAPVDDTIIFRTATTLYTFRESGRSR